MKKQNSMQAGLPAVASAEAGQTLIEILLAFSVCILVLSAIIIGISTSLSNTQYTKNQNLANSYAKEGMTVVRQLRDSSWNNFHSLRDLFTTNTKYCLGQNPMELKELTLQNCWAQSPVPVGGIFSREVKFEHDSVDCSGGSKVTVKVSWSDSKCPVGNPRCHNVTLISCFSNLDQKQSP